MRYFVDAQKILADAYISLVEDALKNGNKYEGVTVRCCRCKRCDVTLRKLHNGVYACTDCIEKRAREVTDEERKKAKAD